MSIQRVPACWFCDTRLTDATAKILLPSGKIYCADCQDCADDLDQVVDE